MRRILTLLAFIALLAVLLVGFLAMQKQTDTPTITHQFKRVMPAPPAPMEVDTIEANPPVQTKELPKAQAPTIPVPAPKLQTDFDSNGTFTLKKFMRKNGFHEGEPVVVIVDNGAHFTYVLQKQGEKVAIVYRASNATGSADTPSPPGPYKIAQITMWPAWVPPRSIDPKQKPIHPYNKDRRNPLGVARIRLDKFDVSLHGTNNPRSIRRSASHGCIRHSNKDIMKMLSYVKKGDTVIITNRFVGTKISKNQFEQ